MRATGAGVAAALLTLLLLLRGLFAVLDPVAPAVAQVGAGALVVFVAAVLGGVAGAWQAALAGVRSRHEIVVVGRASVPGRRSSPSAWCCPSRSRVSPGRALRGAGRRRGRLVAGAWLLPAVALLLARLRGERGQTSAEYMGALLLVAVIVAALLFLGPLLGERTSSAVEAIAGGSGQSGQVGAGNRAVRRQPHRRRRRRRPQQRGGGRARHRSRSADSDGDGVSDNDEFTHGTDPNQGISR